MAKDSPGQSVTAQDRSLNTSREVKLSETLRTLLDVRGFSRKHGAVADGVGVSRSALSQYLSGRAQPSLDTLVRLADFLETSLDYLVFGTETVQRDAIDPSPLVGYIDTALADLQRRAADHATLLSRIAGVLGTQIDEAASRVANDLEGTTAGGLLSDSETLALERYSEFSRIASTTLDDDVLEVEKGVAAAGRFTDVVAQNLRRGRGYRFLVPSALRPWGQLVNGYRRILADHGVSDEALGRRCLFRETTSYLPVGFAFYRLGEALSLAAPLLYEHVRHLLGPDRSIGYVFAPSKDLNSVALMDRASLEHASRCFDAIWEARTSQPL